jgi:hypothetical protein
MCLEKRSTNFEPDVNILLVLPHIITLVLTIVYLKPGVNK